jgi:2-dehydro-3-deoxy-D-arabinonate dehydratase
VGTELTVTGAGLLVNIDGDARLAPSDATVDAVFSAVEPEEVVAAWHEAGSPPARDVLDQVIGAALPPIGSQEVWAAGVTYQRSRAARVAESADAGGSDFYDLVYDAERPELFLKATPHRVVGHGGSVRIRRDSTWDVPEPELVVAVNRHGTIFGATIGNDLSSRSIEGENPLYLPQAKVSTRSAGLGPSLVLGPLPGAGAAIGLTISRDDEVVFAGATTLASMKREPADLVAWLWRDNEFPAGAFLMTGTGVVPDDAFTLAVGDVIVIEIDGLGRLVNHVD